MDIFWAFCFGAAGKHVSTTHFKMTVGMTSVVPHVGKGREDEPMIAFVGNRETRQTNCARLF